MLLNHADVPVGSRSRNMCVADIGKSASTQDTISYMVFCVLVPSIPFPFSGCDSEFDEFKEERKMTWIYSYQLMYVYDAMA
jgi:hypothetical protein